MPRDPLTTYEWVEAQMDHLTPSQKKKIPKWARMAALGSDGVVYIPDVIAGSPMEILLCAGYDGTPSLVDGDHAYYPAQWVAKEFPKAKETAEKIEWRVREHFNV